MSTQTLIPAKHGIATMLATGRTVKVINTYGTQVIDMWAFSTSLSSSTASPPDYQDMSMAHTHASLGKLIPQVSDILVSNERKPMLTLVEDTSDGAIDTVMAACDRWRYEQLGAEEGHRNCADNLVEAMTALDIPAPPFTPSPLNLFMSVPVHEDRNTVSFEAPVKKPGSYISLRAEMDLLIVFSACPQDLIKINAGAPTSAHFEIL